MKKFPVLAAVIMFLGTTSSAFEESHGLEYGLPFLTAQIEIRGDRYEQFITLDMPRTHSMAEFASVFRNKTYIEDFNKRMKSAKVDFPDKSRPFFSEITLVVGGMGLYYEHRYDCSEAISDTEYRRVCIQNEGRGKPLLHFSRREIVCWNVTTGQGPGSHCEHRHTGVASKFQIPLIKKISAFEMASYLYYYEVGYLAQVGLVLSGDRWGANPGHIRHVFNEHQGFRWYKIFEQKLDAFLEIYKDMAPVEQHRATVLHGLETFAVTQE